MDDVINLAKQLNSTNLSESHYANSQQENDGIFYGKRPITVYDFNTKDPTVQLYMDLYVITNTRNEAQACVQLIRLLDRILPGLWEKLLYTLNGCLHWRVELNQIGLDYNSLNDLQWGGIAIQPTFEEVMGKVASGGTQSLLPFLGSLIYVIGKTYDDGTAFKSSLSTFSDTPLFKELKHVLHPSKSLLAGIRRIFTANFSIRSQVFFRIIEISDEHNPISFIFSQILHWFEMDDCAYVWLVKDYLVSRHPRIFGCPEMKSCLDHVHHFVDLSSSLPNKYAPFVHLLSEEGHDPRPELLFPCQVALELLGREDPSGTNKRLQFSFEIPEHMQAKATVVVDRYLCSIG